MTLASNQYMWWMNRALTPTNHTNLYQFSLICDFDEKYREFWNCFIWYLRWQTEIWQLKNRNVNTESVFFPFISRLISTTYVKPPIWPQQEVRSWLRPRATNQGMTHGIIRLQQLSAVVCYFVPLRSEYFSPNRVLKHHQPIFTPQDQGKISRQTKRSVKLQIYTSSSCFFI
jgi:hypothetical protein